jgi:hypothetical protein
MEDELEAAVQGKVEVFQQLFTGFVGYFYAFIYIAHIHRCVIFVIS